MCLDMAVGLLSSGHGCRRLDWTKLFKKKVVILMSRIVLNVDVHMANTTRRYVVGDSDPNLVSWKRYT